MDEAPEPSLTSPRPSPQGREKEFEEFKEFKRERKTDSGITWLPWMTKRSQAPLWKV